MAKQADREAATIRCPTCNASQAPSIECRRCRCDLSLLVETRQARERWRHACLKRLADHDAAGAIAAARRAWEMGPDPEIGRLLAVAYLLSGRHQAALAVRDLVNSLDA